MNETIPQSVVPIGSDRRTAFKETLVPHATEARKQFAVLNQFTRIAGDLQAARQLSVKGSPEEKDLLNEWMGDLRKEQFTLGGGPYRALAQETFRQEVNILRTAYDNWKIENEIASGNIIPLRAMEVARPQIPPTIIGRREPDSPPRLHHGLGLLPIHRTVEPPADIRMALKVAASKRWPQDEQSRKITEDVLRLFPDSFLRGSRPSALRKTGDIASAVVDVTGMLIDYAEGRIMSPSGKDVGQPSAQQEDHILAGIRIILLHELYAELVDPAITERGFLLRVQKNISSNINQLAELIDKDGFARIAQAIESLPDVEAALLRSRLSISEDIKLGFPRSELAHPRRFAEMLNWSIYSRENRVSVETDFGKRWVPGSLAVNLMLGKLQEREETGDIDFSEVIGPIAQLPYGEKLLKEVFEAADDDHRSFLVTVISDTGMLDDLRRELQDLMEFGDDVRRSDTDADLREYLTEHSQEEVS